eukprot:g22040.t1
MRALMILLAFLVGISPGTVFAAESAEFFRGLNLNGPAVVIDGHLWEGKASNHYRCRDRAFENQSVPLLPATDATRTKMIRSSRWGGNRVELTHVPKGFYSVFLYVWEDNNSEKYHISVNGREVVRRHVSGGAGQWHKLGPWFVEVEKGSIEITSRGGTANFSGIEVWRGKHTGTTVPLTDADLTFFEKRIRPVLVKHCYECHSGKSKELQGELLVDSLYAIRKGGETGPAVVPGDLKRSLLISAIRYQNDKLQMPPAGKLSNAEIADLEEWVKRGAPDPRTRVTKFVRKKIDFTKARSFWSFRPVARPAVPSVADSHWSRNEIDRFILAELEKNQLAPVKLADKQTLIRRATFDLTGLPPTPEEVAAFVADDSPKAFEKVVDRLLASRHYGERWGRHWMDLVRYADTAGDNSDYPIPQVYRYRNYIIDSFNADKPYDQFLREQIAGDLLPWRDEDQRNEQLIATGYIAISRRFGSLVANYPQHLTIEDTIDNLGRTVLGLTLSCARCHDHKFDPIAQDDYYGLYGFFESTRYPFPGIELDKKPRDFVPLWRNGKPGKQLAYAVAEGQPGDARLHRRGDPKNPGEPVPRHFPGVLGGQTLATQHAKQSGRRQLAEWLTDRSNPLTARVMVNRIWQYHFGAGLVRTPSDFGKRGQPPTHPALLDWLASRFMAEGWSIKAMHRLMMLSRTYQLASTDDDPKLMSRRLAVDPDNTLHWKHNRQRLDAESLRDAILAISGALDDSMMTGPHPFPPASKWKYTQHHPFRDRYPSNRRSVYLMTARLNTRPFFTTFDGADRNATTPTRDSSVTTIQSLYLLNDAFVHEQAGKFAEQLLQSPAADAARIRTAYLKTLGRKSKLMGSVFPYRANRRCGTEVSDLFPHLREAMDDICVIRSMKSAHFDHTEAAVGMHTGSPTFARPSMGSWLSYGLGTFNRNLPSFIVIAPHLPYGGTQVYANDFLPAYHQGTRVIPGRQPIRNLTARTSRDDIQKREMALLKQLNRKHLRQRQSDLDLSARIKSFETAFQMQTAGPEAFDLKQESPETLQLYGLRPGENTGFAWQCIVARRLAERGVRFIELVDSGSRPNWDSHGNMNEHRPLAKASDQPLAALIADLKRRGMLDETLIVWATEFGRTPAREGKFGRGHHGDCFSVDAEVARVWKAFTTDKGLRSWMAPVVEFELKLGGKMKANYNPKGKIGDETTIENTVLAYDPQRMLALKATKFPKGFPFKEAAGSAWSVFYFTSLPSKRTRITVVGNGYTESEQSKKMRSFFATANKYSLDKLKHTRDSGLLDELIPVFEKNADVRVDVVATGTGAALKLGSVGDVDVVLVHDRAGEDAFMRAGHGIRREDLMYNTFQILGPPDDPAGIRKMHDPAEALRQIASRRAKFVSRGDESGTHRREMKLWGEGAGLPKWSNYLESGQGMGATLTMADQMNAYVLSDRSTFLKFKKRIQLIPLVTSSVKLRNPYALLVVNPKSHSGVNRRLAEKFEDTMLLTHWLKHNRFGKRLAAKRRRNRLGAAGAAGQFHAQPRLGFSGETLEDRVLLTAPVADAGGPYSAMGGETIFLDGSASTDADGTIEFYRWDLDEDGNFGETGVLAGRGDEVGVNPPLVAADFSTTWNIALKVVDNDGEVSLADTTTVTITAQAQFPDAPTLTGPPLQTDDTTPTFTWTSVEGSVEYELLVYDVAAGQLVIDQTAIADTSFTAATALSAGTEYQVFVRGVNASGEAGFYSDPLHFTITGTASGTPSFTAPDIVTDDTTPTFAWTSVEGSAQYELLVYNVATGQPVIHQTGIVSTSFTSSVELNGGTEYQAFVRSIDASGNAGVYSDPLHFTITGEVIGTPSFTAPTGTIEDMTPTYAWTSVSGAAEYELVVYDVAAGQAVVAQTGITATSTTPNVQLSAGLQYQAFVRAINGDGQVGEFSAALEFFVSASAPPSEPVLSAPAPTTPDTTPTFVWSSVSGAADYQLIVYDIAAGQAVITQNNIVSTSFTPAVPMLAGRDYQAFVRAFDSFGQPGGFSGAHEFTVTGTVTLGTPDLIEPTDPTNDLTPTFVWTSATGAAEYQLLVYNIAAGQAVINTTVSATSYTPVSNLQANVRYQAFVRAINSEGILGPWSVASEFDIEGAVAASSGASRFNSGDLDLLDSAFAEDDSVLSV